MDSEVSIYSKNGRRPSGTFIFTNVETGKAEEYHSAKCVHCGLNWQVKPGSGKIRGWCTACQGLTCGRKVCNKYHFPVEAQVETIEALHGGNMRAAIKLLSKYGRGIILGQDA